MRLKLRHSVLLGLILIYGFSSFAQKQEPQFLGGKSMLDTFLNMKMVLPDSMSDDYLLTFGLHINKEGKALNPKASNPIFQTQLENAVAEMPLWDISSLETSNQGYNLTIRTTLLQAITLQPDKMPKYHGGTSAMYRFISENIQVPSSLKIKSKVTVRFVINKVGKVIQPEILRSGGEGCDVEALRLLNKMPRWIPAKLNNKNVATYFTMPFIFEPK